MKQPLVTILTVNFNSDKYTINLLNSIKNINYKNFNVIIIDNGSKIESYNAIKNSLKKYKFKIYLIRSNNNIGWTGGCNIGIKKAISLKAKYLFTINNDTIVDKNLLKEVVDVAELDSNVGCVGVDIRNVGKGDTAQITGSQGGKITFLTKLTGVIQKNKRFMDAKDVIKLNFNEFVDDCARLNSIKAFKKFRYDESLFLYYEDVDLSLRMKKSGYNFYYTPKAVVWHEEYGSSGRVKNPIPIFYLTRNRIIVFWKHFKLYFPIVVLTNVLLILIQFIKYTLRGRADLLKYFILGIYSAFSFIIFKKVLLLKKNNLGNYVVVK